MKKKELNVEKKTDTWNNFIYDIGKLMKKYEMFCYVSELKTDNYYSLIFGNENKMKNLPQLNKYKDITEWGLCNWNDFVTVLDELC